MAFETALTATMSPLIRGHLLAAKLNPIPATDGRPLDADGLDMEYVGVALQVYPLANMVGFEVLHYMCSKYL